MEKASGNRATPQLLYVYFKAALHEMQVNWALKEGDENRK
jgi:hypothetical protein